MNDETAAELERASKDALALSRSLRLMAPRLPEQSRRRAETAQGYLRAASRIIDNIILRGDSK